MKTAVLFNPQAGKGLPAEQVMVRLASFFPEDELLVTMEELVVKSLPVRCIRIPSGDGSYLGILTARVRAMTEAGAQRLVCVGGDGTAAYAASILHRLGCRLPILGVAAGTANVGPVVSVGLEQLAGKTVSQTREVCFDGIEVRRGGEFLSLAFNDVVIGDTFLSTVAGRACSVSAAALLKGQGIVPKRPSQELIPEEMYVEKNGRKIFPRMGAVKQIILSTVANEPHYGRAIYGPLCNCQWTGKQGVIALCDHVAVSMEAENAGIDEFSAMQYLLFGEGDHVVVQNLAPEACVICDGNPYFLTDNMLEVCYRPAAVRTILL